MLSSALSALILGNLPALQKRDYLLDLFTITDPFQLLDGCHSEQGGLAISQAPLYQGQLVQYKGMLYKVDQIAILEDAGETGLLGTHEAPLTSYGKWYTGTGEWMGPGEAVDRPTVTDVEDVIYDVTLIATSVPVPKPDTALTSPQDQLMLPPGIVANYPEGEPIKTNIGILIWNYLIFCLPFGPLIPYHNDEWVAHKIQATVSDLIISEKITAEQADLYARNIYFIGPATELCVPSYSERSLVTSPEVKKRKKELLAQYAEELKQGDAVVMSKIENELIALDKAWMKGDIATHFLVESKSWNVHRKRLFCTTGIVENFGADGTFSFVENSLNEGWTQEDFAVRCNDIRQGSQKRALETAKGGVVSKDLMRVFQNALIQMEDCEAKTGLPFSRVVKPRNRDEYLFRNAIVKGKLVQITEENVDELMRTPGVQMRSPQHCKAPSGPCFTCMGKRFKTLNQRHLTMVAVEVGSYFLRLSLKAMHGIKVGTVEIRSLNEFTF